MLLALVARHYAVTCDNNTGELGAAKPSPAPASMAGLSGKRLFWHTSSQAALEGMSVQWACQLSSGLLHVGVCPCQLI